MSKWKKLASAFLLTLLLVGVAMVNGTQLLGEVSNSQIGESQVSYARLPYLTIKKAWYGDNGEFLGCYSSGKNCIVIVIAGATVHAAPGGVLVK